MHSHYSYYAVEIFNPKCRSCAKAASATTRDGGGTRGLASIVVMTSVMEVSRSAYRDGKHMPYQSEWKAPYAISKAMRGDRK